MQTSAPSFLKSSDLVQALDSLDTPLGHALRRPALDRFTQLGVSVADREEWKYCRLKGVIEGDLAPCFAPGRSSEELQSWIPETTGIKVVFVNGGFRADLSSIDNLPAGVHLQSMASASAKNEFGQLANFNDAPFTALNTALWQDGLYLELAAEAELTQPVAVIHLSDGDAGGCFLAPRHLIIAGPESRASIVEYYGVCDPNADTILNLPVTEIFCGRGADVSHLKIVQENANHWHLGSTHVHQAADSRFTSREFALNGNTIRRELHLQLAGEGAACDLNALSMGRGSRQVDMRTRVDHLVSGCRTDELYKNILAEKSRGIFDGLIKVARDAQQTVAHQTNRNLVLSDEAVAYSIPRLEIYADDVKCSHGSTTGQLDDEQIFFLRSRGFSAHKARALLAAAFAREIIISVSDPFWRKFLDQEVALLLADPAPREKA